MKSKEITQEILNMSVLYQNKVQSKVYQKHPNKFVIT